VDKIKNLKIVKLLKELDYFETAHEYTSEIISEFDAEFIQGMNKFLNDNPELKEQYDKKVDDMIEAELNRKKKQAEVEEARREQAEKEREKEKIMDDEPVEDESEPEIEEDEEEPVTKRNEPPKKIKKLYREIVKLTHPDKVDDFDLNKLYIEATGFYNKNDKLGIYKVCNDLNIKYDLDADDDSIILKKIDKLKNEINFMESTYTWKWFNTEDEQEKDQLLISFIKMKLNSRSVTV
jgi:hypothetical protein